MRRLLPLSLATLLILAGCGAGSPEAARDDHADHDEAPVATDLKLNKDQEKIAGIEVEAVVSRMIQASLEVPGNVTSTTQGRAVVTPTVAGRLIKLTVQIGDEVHQGQVLGVIESTELAQAWASISDAQRIRDAAAASVQESKAQVQIATGKLASARTVLARQKQFAAAGAFNQAPLQQAQNELNDAQSEVLSAQKEQASHAEQFRRLENLYKEGLVSKSEIEASRLELQQDEIRLNRAKSKVDILKSTYEREKNIAQRGLANSREVQTAEAEVRSAQLERDRALTSLRSAESALANANRSIGTAQATYRTFSGGAGATGGRVNLLAPISGKITHTDVTRGQAVERTQTLFEIENLASVWVTASVPEKEAAKIQKGGRVRITVAALAGEEFEGIVQIVGGRIDPKTRAVPMECLVTGANGRLKPDMFATVHLGFGEMQERLVIKQTAIVREGNKTVVFVKDEHGYEEHEVTLGDREGEGVTVFSGLKAGDQVVVKGAFVLSSEEKKAGLKGHEH